jgi:hypothetical protein
MKTFAALMETILVQTIGECLDEERDMQQTLNHLKTVMDRPGTPEEGQTARAHYERLSRRHGDNGSRPGTSTSSATYTPPASRPRTRASDHPFHATAMQHGFTHTPENDTEENGKTVHTFTKGPRRLALYTHQNKTAMKHQWASGSGHSGYDAKSLNDHLRN